MRIKLKLTYVEDNFRILVCVSWATSLLLYLTLAPSRDQFNHAYMGWRLLDGAVLYRDIFDQNWPGVAALHAFAIWLFGVNLWSWRLLDFLLFGLSVLCLADLLSLAVNDGARRLALILIPLIYISVNYGIAGQHDMTASQFLIGAVWSYVRGQQRSGYWWMVACGWLLGLAILNKPTVGVILILFFSRGFWLQQHRWRIVYETAVILTATLVTVLSAFLVILVMGAQSQDIIDLLYTLSIVRRAEIDRSLLELTLRVWSITFHPWWYALLIGSLPAAAWFVRVQTRTLAGVALLGIWLTGLLSYLIQGSGSRYHLAPSYLAMAAGSAASVQLVASGLQLCRHGRWRDRIERAFVFFVLATICMRLLISFYTLPAGLIHGSMYPHWARIQTSIPMVTVADILSFIDRLPPLPSAACVLVVGNESSLNYLTLHPQPTRFYYFEVLATARTGLPMAERWSQYWQDDIEGRHCPIVIITREVAEKWLPSKSRAAKSLRELLTSYRRNYDFDAPQGLSVYTAR